MPIQIAWDDADHTILLEQFAPLWTIEEYLQVVDEAAARLAQTGHYVHIVLDMTHSRVAPAN
ncbi:MAG: hypothetical protein MUE40_04035, partial [Anaerolineae bacterium]|nr:hypothetical protein [Anaerolineae bacterium]